MALATASPSTDHPPADEAVRAVTAADGLEAGLRRAGIGSGDLGTASVRLRLDPLHLASTPASRERRAPLRHLPARTLLWLRLGASEHLLRTTVDHLRGRQLGDGLLIHNPVVRTQLALAATEQLVVEAELTEQVGVPRTDSARRLNRTLTDIDRLLLRLLGAWSFLEAGPGTDALVSECLPGFASAGES